MAFDLGVDTNLDTERYKTSLPSLPLGGPESGNQGLPALQTGGQPAMPQGPSSSEQLRALMGQPVNLPTQPTPTGNPVTDTIETVSEATGGLLFPRAQQARMDRFRAERDKIVQERKIQLEELKAYADMDKAQLTTSLSVIGAMRDFLRDKPDATPEEINTAKTQFNAMGVKAGAPNQDELLTLMGNQRTLAQVAGKYLPWVEDSKQLGVGVNILKGMAKAGASEDDTTGALAKMFGPGVRKDAFDAVREVAGALKRSGKVDKDGNPDDLTIIDQVAARGAKGPVLAEFLLGQDPHLKPSPEEKAWLERAGLKNPETAAAAVRARDIKRGEVEGGPLNLDSPVNKKLVGVGLDPRKLDPDNPAHQAAIRLAEEVIKKDEVTQKAAVTGAERQATLSTENAPGNVAASANRVAQKYANTTKPLTPAEVGAIRDDYRQLSGPWANVRDAYARVEDSYKRGVGAKSSAADLSLVYSYIKILDPTSVVREGELALAGQTKGVPDSVVNLYNQFVQGKVTLTDNQRKNFRDEAKGLVRTQLQTQLDLEKNFRDIATKRKADPDEAVPPAVVGRFRNLMSEDTKDTTEPKIGGDPLGIRKK
jgi:hypothetical protein